MLNVVVKRKKPKGIAQKFKFIFEKKIKIFNVKAPNFSYKLITVKKNKLTSTELEAIVDVENDEIIIQNGIKLSDYTNINAPKGNLTSENLMYDLLKTALIEKKSEMAKNKLNKKRVLLVDFNGKYERFLKLLITSFSSITVLTNKMGVYERLATELFEEKGIAIIVTNYLYNVNDIVMIISPSNDNIHEYERTGIIYITAQKFQANLEYNYYNFCASPHEKIAKYIPNSIDEEAFLFGVVNSSGYSPTYFKNPVTCRNNEKISNFSDDLVRLMGYTVK